MNEQNDHDLLIRLEGKVDALTDKVAELTDTTKDTIQDHESRLRFLERYAWIAIGVLGIIQFIGFGYVITHLQNGGQ